jgi:hypothetical protein
MLQRLYLGHAAACESLSPLSSVCLCRRAYCRLSLINSVLWPLPIREHPGGDVHAGRLNRLRLVDRFPFGALRPGLRAAHISALDRVHASASCYSTTPSSVLPYTHSCARPLPPSPHSLSITFALSAPPPAFRGNRSLNLINGPPLLAILITTRTSKPHDCTVSPTSSQSLCRAIPVPQHRFLGAYLACTTLRPQCEYSPQLPALDELPRSICFISPLCLCCIILCPAATHQENERY